MAETKDDRYKNGKIYRLVNNVDEEFYVGSTCGRLAKRKSDHKTKARKDTARRVYEHLNKVGWGNVDIVLVEEYACENKNQLERRERHWIETLKPSLNRAVPTRTNKEWKTENADKVRESGAKYRAENADKELERHTKYRAENAEKVRESRAKYWEANRENERERNAKYRAENAEKERERCAKYREANRDAINARAREQRAQKKAEAQQQS